MNNKDNITLWCSRSTNKKKTELSSDKLTKLQLNKIKLDNALKYQVNKFSPFVLQGEHLKIITVRNNEQEHINEQEYINEKY